MPCVSEIATVVSRTKRGHKALQAIFAFQRSKNHVFLTYVCMVAQWLIDHVFVSLGNK